MNATVPHSVLPLIFDAHCDTAHALYTKGLDFENGNLHVNAAKAAHGGLRAQIFALWVDPVFMPHRSLHKALLLYHTLTKRVFAPGLAVKVTTMEEMGAAVQQGSLAGWIFLEGGHIIENSTEILYFFYTLGIRGMTLTHTRHTDWADSSQGEPRWNGLNDRGKEIVRFMNRLGMAVDVSHASDKTVLDVLDVSRAPVMASHSGARALCDVPRNLSDRLIREIASSGGFIGVNFYPAFLRKEVYDHIGQYLERAFTQKPHSASIEEEEPEEESRREWEILDEAARTSPPASLKDVLDHIVHIAETGGIECVGLGSDFDGIPLPPAGLEDASCFGAIASGLRERGCTASETAAVMGSNLVSYLEKVITPVHS